MIRRDFVTFLHRHIWCTARKVSSYQMRSTKAQIWLRIPIWALAARLQNQWIMEKISRDIGDCDPHRLVFTLRMMWYKGGVFTLHITWLMDCYHVCPEILGHVNAQNAGLKILADGILKYFSIFFFFFFFCSENTLWHFLCRFTICMKCQKPVYWEK